MQHDPNLSSAISLPKDQFRWIILVIERYLREKRSFKEGEYPETLSIIPTNRIIQTEIPYIYPLIDEQLLKQPYKYYKDNGYDDEKKKQIFENLTNLIQAISDAAQLKINLSNYDAEVEYEQLAKDAFTNGNILDPLYVEYSSHAENNVNVELETGAEELTNADNKLIIERDESKVEKDDFPYQIRAGRIISVKKLRIIAIPANEYNLEDISYFEPKKSVNSSVSANVNSYNLSAVLTNAIVTGSVSPHDYKCFRTVINYINRDTPESLIFKEKEFGNFTRSYGNTIPISDANKAFYNKLYIAWSDLLILNPIACKSICENLFSEFIVKLRMCEQNPTNEASADNVLNSNKNYNIMMLDADLSIRDLALFCSTLDLDQFTKENCDIYIRSVVSTLMLSVANRIKVESDKKDADINNRYTLFPIREVGVYGNRFSFMTCALLLTTCKIVREFFGGR